MHQSQASLPSFTGLQVHYDEQLRFSVLLPVDWTRLDVEGSGGAFFAPDTTDLATGMVVDGRDLGTDVTPGDLATLRTGFVRGLRELPECRIESRSAEVVGDLITMEARHTFKEGDAVRKRWVRLLYQGRTQVRLVAQAASAEQFAYWEPMFFTTMRTMRFGRYV